MKKAKKLYKVYVDGGEMGKTPKGTNMAMFGQLGGMAAGVMDGFAPTDHVPSVGFSGAKGALSGAAAGAQFGPYGALVGGVVGGAAGVVSGIAAKKEEKIQTGRALQEQQRQDIARGNAAVAADPTLIQGNRNVDYYASGGNMPSMNMLGHVKAYGGNLTPLSKNNTEVNGPSHAGGGVTLPSMNAEVEGGETTMGNQVFSKDLGFADLHKPIAKGIGKIEKKAPTIERINSLNRLRDQEQALYQAQEIFKMLNQQ